MHLVRFAEARALQDSISRRIRLYDFRPTVLQYLRPRTLRIAIGIDGCGTNAKDMGLGSAAFDHGLQRRPVC